MDSAKGFSKVWLLISQSYLCCWNAGGGTKMLYYIYQTPPFLSEGWRGSRDETRYPLITYAWRFFGNCGLRLCVEALQLRAVYKKPYFLLEVTRESVSALQVTWESKWGTASHTRIGISTTSHVRIKIRYSKSRAWVWTCNESECLYDKIIITIVPSYTGKNITHLLPLALLLVLRTCYNTDGNKLVIFSSIASYYGNTYIYYRYPIVNC